MIIGIEDIHMEIWKFGQRTINWDAILELMTVT